MSNIITDMKIDVSYQEDTFRRRSARITINDQYVGCVRKRESTMQARKSKTGWELVFRAPKSPGGRGFLPVPANHEINDHDVDFFLHYAVKEYVAKQMGREHGERTYTKIVDRVI